MRLTKHHGLGNDFLVLLDLEGDVAVDGELARALCDRRTGVGADGLVRVTPGAGDAEVSMALFNSDGSAAELSGNGVRCVGQAVALHRGVERLELTVRTAAGPRAVTIAPGGDFRTAWGSVDMGEAKVTLLDDPVAGSRSAEVDLGNPHLVVLDEAGAVDVAALGPSYPDRNVEVVRPGPEPGALTMDVWERGAGPTLACGTGACASAAAARDWGLVGDAVTVHMRGGDAEVAFGDGVVLSGPCVFVATIEVPWR